jgi:hypothetical protein
LVMNKHERENFQTCLCAPATHQPALAQCFWKVLELARETVSL